jgi:YD repeat-containing protein
LGQASCYNIGRRTSMTDAAGSEAWSYDTMGRALTDQRTTNSVTKSTVYTYNYDGSTATLTYPSGRTITYTYDNAERSLKAEDTANGIDYATGAAYAPQGALQSMTLGYAGSFAGVNLSLSYNTRLQPQEIEAWSTTSTAMELTYNFVDVNGHNNGNVMGTANSLNSARTVGVTTTATTPGPTSFPRRRRPGSRARSHSSAWAWPQTIRSPTLDFRTMRPGTN